MHAGSVGCLWRSRESRGGPNFCHCVQDPGLAWLPEAGCKVQPWPSEETAAPVSGIKQRSGPTPYLTRVLTQSAKTRRLVFDQEAADFSLKLAASSAEGKTAPRRGRTPQPHPEGCNRQHKRPQPDRQAPARHRRRNSDRREPRIQDRIQSEPVAPSPRRPPGPTPAPEQQQEWRTGLASHQPYDLPKA